MFNDEHATCDVEECSLVLKWQTHRRRRIHSDISHSRPIPRGLTGKKETHREGQTQTQFAYKIHELFTSDTINHSTRVRGTSRHSVLDRQCFAMDRHRTPVR